MNERQPKGDFRATHIVHWPTGPLYACEEHAKTLVGLGKFLGSKIVVSLTPEDSEVQCKNCQNEVAQHVVVEPKSPKNPDEMDKTEAVK